jgi:hypothetical protein
VGVESNAGRQPVAVISREEMAAKRAELLAKLGRS